MILDIHTHHPFPQPFGLISIRFKEGEFESTGSLLRPDQFYSVGVHPWDVEMGSGSDSVFWNEFEELASRENVLAIGEAGLDPNGQAPMFIQLLVLKKQIEISEKLGKPLILHDVKSDDMICGLRRDLNPKMNWMVHGYRGKARGATQLVKRGCWISFGEKFNVETLQAIPLDKILAETDESSKSIEEIIFSLSEVRGIDLKPIIAENSAKFLNFERL